MQTPLFILSPPRSFSSVVSTMVGEHPDLYGFAELHLFVGDTVQDLLDYGKGRIDKPFGQAGLLRTLAQLHDGTQTNGTIVRASFWLNERRHWSCKQVMDHLLEATAPRIGVEKSPITSYKTSYIERAYACYPDALFLHLTRHPLTARSSMKDFFETKPGAVVKEQRVDFLLLWHLMHTNILKFTSSLPAGQWMRVRGEDVLSEPDVFLPQLAEWMGIRTDREAIEAMKHPENSPFACIGPDLARGGNDGKFMRSPKLRPGRIKEPSLAAYMEANEVRWFPDRILDLIRDSGLELVPEQDMKEEILEMASLLGYQ